jgi:hypothetical protein
VVRRAGQVDALIQRMYTHYGINQVLAQRALMMGLFQENIDAFFIGKTFEQNFEQNSKDYNKKRQIDGLRCIDEKALRNLIRKSIEKTDRLIDDNHNIQDEKNRKKETKKALIPLIIQIFKMDINIKDYEGEDYRIFLIDKLINILTESENTDLSIFNCLSNDQRTEMQVIVRTLIGLFFPRGKFQKVYINLGNLLTRLKKYITPEEVDENIILFVMEKEFEKYYPFII